MILSPSSQTSTPPLLPPGTWDYFCLDRVPYHGRSLTILYDKTGKRYNQGAGLRLLVDGEEIASSRKLTRLTAALPDR
ncbi:MAG: glycosyl hydrolase family 65 protein [Haloferula sp.]